MLRIPVLRPDQEPYDAVLPLRMQRSSEEHEKKGTTGDGADGLVPENGSVNYDHLLDFALVKDLLTDLHQDGDGQMEKYVSYTGRDIGNIVSEQQLYIKKIKAKYLAMVSEERQKNLFHDMSRWYFQHLLISAQTLQAKKTLEYLGEAVERQNAVLLSRALRQENVCDDSVQTMLRNMILLNKESIGEYLPAEQRKANLDDAARNFYIQVLERRLEQNPQSVRTMIQAEAVRRVLGKEVIAHYEKRTRKAETDEERRKKATQWCDENLNCEEAKRRVGRESLSAEDAHELMEEFLARHFRREREKISARLQQVSQLWRIVVENGGSIEALPAGTRRNDPELSSFIRESLLERERQGGLSPEPDYEIVASLGEECRKEKLVERLAEETKFYQYISRLGGPDTQAYACLSHIFSCQETAMDRRWLDELAMAKKLWGEKNSAVESTPLSMQEFLSLFNKTRELKLVRDGEQGLDPLTISRICHELMMDASGLE